MLGNKCSDTHSKRCRFNRLGVAVAATLTFPLLVQDNVAVHTTRGRCSVCDRLPAEEPLHSDDERVIVADQDGGAEDNINLPPSRQV